MARRPLLPGVDGIVGRSIVFADGQERNQAQQF
jgi:hypothetical protein